MDDLRNRPRTGTGGSRAGTGGSIPTSMGDYTQRIMQWAESGQDERRRCGRIHTELLKCNLGSVVDLSASGMKVRRKSIFRPRRRRTRVVLRTIDGVSTIPARIVRVHKIAPRTWDLGIEFARIDERMRTRITEIARLAGVRTTVNPSMHHHFDPVSRNDAQRRKSA